jgi:2'-5' RNA ligase
VDDSRVAGLCDSLKGIRADGAIALAADHLLCFPPRGGIRIIGAGVSNPPPELMQLVDRIETVCGVCGFVRENRPYRAHITLARAHKPLPPDLRPQLEEAVKICWPGPSMAADQFVLMESRLSNRGAEYVPSARFYINLPI